MIDWDKVVLQPLVDVFGEEFTYEPLSGQSFTIHGVYDAQYKGVEVADGMPVTTDMPVLGVRLAEFPAPPKKKDRLTRVATGEQFIVKEVQPDGHGSAKLMLNSAKPLLNGG